MRTDIVSSVFAQLQNSIPNQQKIVVWVSGWPDSMALLWILQKYFDHQKRDQSNICVAHFNHGQRKESAQEHNFLQNYCKKNTFYRNLQKPTKWLSETKLRDLRHEFFDEVMQDAHATYLFLWHNLTDRIETTMLNMVRGANLPWFLSIKPQNTKHNYIQIRPLLEYSKRAIQQFCDTHSIPYFIDKTNTQDITARNKLRNTIFPQIYTMHDRWEDNRNNSRKSVYEKLSQSWSTRTATSNAIITHKPNKYRGATFHQEFLYKNLTKDLLFEILKRSKKIYLTQEMIQNILDFASWDEKWHMLLGWMYIFKAPESMHFIDGKKDFWKNTISTKKLITHSWILQFDQNIYTIPTDLLQKWVPLFIRYPQVGDIYKKKPLSKAFISKKIPLFMRNIIPVLARKNEIIAILD